MHLSHQNCFKYSSKNRRSCDGNHGMSNQLWPHDHVLCCSARRLLLVCLGRAWRGLRDRDPNKALPLRLAPEAAASQDWQGHGHPTRWELLHGHTARFGCGMARLDFSIPGHHRHSISSRLLPAQFTGRVVCFHTRISPRQCRLPQRACLTVSTTVKPMPPATTGRTTPTTTRKLGEVTKNKAS